MPEVVIDLTITTLTPLSVGAGGSSGTLADKSIVRDGWGRPLIPGSQVKGKTRHAAEALARGLGYSVADQMSTFDKRCVIQPIFGAAGSRRSPLHFSDLLLVEQGSDPSNPVDHDVTGLRTGHVRPSVAINRRRGTAEDQRLLFQETTVGGVVFANSQAIVGRLNSERELALLLAALRLTTRWGGAKSRGLGWAEVRAAASWNGAPFDDSAFATAFRNWGANP